MHRPVFDLTIYCIVFYVKTLLLVSACYSASLRAYEMYKTIVLTLILVLEVYSVYLSHSLVFIEYSFAQGFYIIYTVYKYPWYLLDRQST